MIAQMEAPRRAKSRRATEGHNETDARLYRSIPSQVDYIPHPEYLSTGTEKRLFGPDAPTISAPQWRPAPELADTQAQAQPPQSRGKLSRQDEALLFMRYNCARYHLGDLMEKQTRRFAASRVPRILAWYRRALENQAVLTQANMALVVAMAKRTPANAMDFGELVSEGNMALLRAVDKFDVSRGFRFSTYACFAILKAFSRLATRAGTYRQRFGTSCEPEMERSDEMERRHADQHDLALDDLQRVLLFNRAGLTNVEHTVLGARFALAGHGRAHTLEEVSGLVRLSREKVRLLQNGALTKLRRALEVAFAPAASSGKSAGTLGNLATSIPGRLGRGVLTAAACET